MRGAYLVLPPAPFRGRSPPASPTSTPVFDCVIYSQRDGTRSWQLQRKWIYFHGPATGQKAVVLMVWVELSNGLLADERPAHENCYVSTVYFRVRTVILSSS